MAIRPVLLAVACLVAPGAATAQAWTAPDRPGGATATQYDEARVVRVDPVFQEGHGDSYSRSGTSPGPPGDSPYAGGPRRDGGYDHDDGGYGQYPAGESPRCYSQRDGGYVDDRGYSTTAGRDRYETPSRPAGSDGGRTIATVIGGVLGAVVGSQVGGGSGRYATSAIGTMVGGIAGREVYEASQRNHVRDGTVTVCDPVPASDRRWSGSGVHAYDVTYEYAGRHYTTRTGHHPGDTIRVRVDITPDE